MPTDPAPTAAATAGRLAPGPAPLGVTAGPDGGVIRAFSENATDLRLVVVDRRDPSWIVDETALERGDDGVWSGSSAALITGARYLLRADGPRGPRHDFDPSRDLLDPYARGLARTAEGGWRAYVQDGAFDWGDSAPPRTPLDHVVIYEAHAKGLTRLHPGVPDELRGTYAGLAHPAVIEHLHRLGVTTLELLPVHQHVTERRLVRQGRVNYWGYNTLGFFTPHAGYATRAAQRGGPGAVLREFKGMVRALHEAGLEVVLDVVYNHTAEEGRDGPTTSLRGLDDSSYYRHAPDGGYVDVTGCGNTLDTSHPAAARLVLDSLRYFADECRIDGFRFDLAPALARDADHVFDPAHPLLAAIRADPVVGRTKLIAEPWDVGPGGWRTGGFPTGWLDWNDGYRDRMRDFWLGDLATARRHGRAPVGIGPMTRRLTGSDHVFDRERGPLASVNLITAHDGFTLHDLTAYDVKHNLGNGEDGRDGSDHNRSFNHGVEGPTDDPEVTARRRRTMRNLLATLLFSGGVPMITAGDEHGRSQGGNNNAYCHDSELTWIDWDLEPWRERLLETTRTLTRLRRENPALRPVRFGRDGDATPSSTRMDWFTPRGDRMTGADWDSPDARTLQYLAASTPEVEEPNRVLLVVHGLEQAITVTLPEHPEVTRYEPLWDSADDGDGGPSGADGGGGARPGDRVELAPCSIRLYRAIGDDAA